MRIPRLLAGLFCLSWMFQILPASAAMTSAQCETEYYGKCNTISASCDTAPYIYNVGDCSGVLFNTPCCAQKALAGGSSSASSSECSKGPAGCCISTIKTGVPDGQGNVVGEIRKEACTSGDIFYGDCYCRVGTAITPPKISQTYNACVEQCKAAGGQMDETQGIGQSGFKPKNGQSGGASFSENQFVNALCFTVSECAAPEYGGSPAAFVAASDCPSGKGKCLAPEPAVHLSSPILGVSDVVGLRQYVTLLFRYMLSIVVLAAAVMFVWGGFKYIVGSSIPEIKTAKDTMVNATIGLLLTFGAVTLLNTINPATTNYSKLNIYLINKQEFSQLEWCKDYKPATPGQTLQFADAGTPAGATKYDSAQFTVEQKLTLCGKDYYPKGFNGKTCKGDSCAPATDKICISCASGIGECNGVKTGSACVKAVFAGNINVVGNVVPKKVYLMAVCGGVQPPKNVQQMKDNIPDYFPMTLTSSVTNGVGQGAYYLQADVAKLDKMFESCQGNKGGMKGFVIGMIYKDTDTAATLALKGVGYAQKDNAGSVGTALSFIGGLTVSLFPSLDDALIVAKPYCGGGPPVYAGYADGKFGADFADMQRAFLHGYALNPNRVGSSSSGHRFDDKSVYWTYAELHDAMTGTGKALNCDIPLNIQNAPPDPEFFLYQFGEDFSDIEKIRKVQDQLAENEKQRVALIQELLATDVNSAKWEDLKKQMQTLIDKSLDLQKQLQ